MATVRDKYNRISKRYNLMEIPAELLGFRHWRKEVQMVLDGEKVLELGVGTGKNIPYYSNGMQVVGIDISEGMLRQIPGDERKKVSLAQMDAQELGFPDEAFDSVFDTFVFCSVPDAFQGLREVYRVVKPGGRFVALEHMRPDAQSVASLFDFFDPITAKMTGVHINRETVRNIAAAGFRIEEVRNLFTSVFRLILARKPINE